MKKSKIPENDENLTETITIRVTPADAAQLREVTAHHRLATRGAVAREALRRGLAAMENESGKVGR